MSNITITLSKEEIERFGSEYDRLPNAICKCCGKDTGKKEIDKRTFMLYMYLRERYY
jgi:hypothetical protein